MNIRSLNLNLLVALDALLSERHVSKAGRKLHLTQSTMSNALVQLRILFKDELLVRGSHGMIPTPRALELAPQVHEVIELIKKTIAPIEPFNPETAQREFRIGMSDYAEFLFLLPLCEYICRNAPGISLHAVHLNQITDSEIFNEKKLDLAIGVQTQPSLHLTAEYLLTERAVCVAAADHPMMQKRLTLSQYLRAKHIVLVYQEDVSQTISDRTLQELGHVRNKVISVPHMNTAMALLKLKEPPLMLTIAERIARYYQNKMSLIIQPPPFKVPETTVVQAWLRKYDNDQGLCWLRNLIKDIALKQVQN